MQQGLELRHLGLSGPREQVRLPFGDTASSQSTGSENGSGSEVCLCEAHGRFAPLVFSHALGIAYD